MIEIVVYLNDTAESTTENIYELAEMVKNPKNFIAWLHQDGLQAIRQRLFIDDGVMVVYRSKDGLPVATQKVAEEFVRFIQEDETWH